jgi:hypothetical protein
VVGANYRDQVQYDTYDGTDWHGRTVVAPPYYGARFASLALDSAGRPGIAYYDSSTVDLRYAQPMTEVQLPIVRR